MYAMGLFLFFGIHNLLQEAIMSFPGFRWGMMLGYLEVLGVTVFTHIERTYTGAVLEKRVAPIKSYGLLTFLLMSSSSLSNISLNYINYPTKVVFRSCKLIPTMLLATLLNQKNFTRLEYLAAGSICVGLILYSFSDSQESAKWSPFGILLVILSICADSALPNTQESLFRMGATRSEVTYYTNVLVLASMTVTVMGSGDLMGVVRFVGERPGVIPYLGLYIGVSYLAITTHMNSIRVFSAVPTVLLGTARKAMTIVVSFLVFP